MKLLLIEDDMAIATMIRRGLTEAGYTVDAETHGSQGLQNALANTYNLIILDVMLPGHNGFEICAELRSHRIQTPILMLTARDTVEDKVRGLDTGADDYLPKPFDFQELMARVRALLRRDKVHKVRMITVGDLVIDTAQHKVTRAGTEVRLSHREYDLLEALAANENRVLSREAIQERIWMNEESYTNTVDVYIGMLRKKIDAGYSVKLIHTVHGVGYTLRLPESETRT
jgi:DNA-binding response OmpR family regulator